MTRFATIAGYGLKEALRRRAFVVVLVLTVAFLGLYWLGVDHAFEETSRLGTENFGVDSRTVAGAFLFGLAIFATLFLGAVLAVFLTVGAVQSDAERGLLQPLLVRPLSRPVFLVARFAGAASVGAAYALAVYGAALGLTNLAGGWWPDQALAPGLELAGAIVVICALSLLGSVVLSSTANGIAIFMIFAAGLVGGLLGQIAHGINSDTLADVSQKVTWALPFEALYQDALYRITSDTHGATRFVLQLGPFGGAEPAGFWTLAWAAAYVGLVGLVAAVAFARRDL